MPTTLWINCNGNVPAQLDSQDSEWILMNQKTVTASQPGLARKQYLASFKIYVDHVTRGKVLGAPHFGCCLLVPKRCTVTLILSLQNRCMTPALDHVVHSLTDRTEIDATDSMTGKKFNFDFEHFEMLHSDSRHAVAGLDQARLV